MAKKQDDARKRNGKPEVPTELKFEYLKGTHFRMVHADGAWIGLNPTGDVHIYLYNERFAIPKETYHNITPEGLLGNELAEKRVGKEGIIRELEVGVTMSPAKLEAFINALQRIQQAALARENELKNEEVDKYGNN